MKMVVASVALLLRSCQTEEIGFGVLQLCPLASDSWPTFAMLVPNCQVDAVTKIVRGSRCWIDGCAGGKLLVGWPAADDGML